ncbi:hypothetical protein ACFOGJ_18685 [Marinibaculum pumilum]|uniref:FHA domain-containing protein n=1 Tax=Marinibaculum pumilum TaxID=1766165 RepID=A0ABV7L4J1_9PROT
MSNRALRIDEGQFELPGMDAEAGEGSSSGKEPGAVIDPQGAPAAADASVGEAMAEPPTMAGQAAPGGQPVADLGPVGVLAGEEAMVRAFNQLRAAVRDASGRDSLAGSGDEAPLAETRTEEMPAPGIPAASGGAPAAEAGPGPESLSAERPQSLREDALFTFGPGGGRVFLSGGAGWTDVVRLQGVHTPPDGQLWNLDLQAGTATEVDGAILLSEDAAGVVRLSDGAELVFSGIERIEW